MSTIHLLFVAMVFWVPALLATPKALPNLHGALVTGVIDRDRFEFTAGTITSCVTSRVSDWIVDDCVLEGTEARVYRGQEKKISVSYTKMNVFRKPTRDPRGSRTEYYLQTAWTEPGEVVPLESDVRVALWFYDETPNRFEGYVSLQNYGVSSPLEAKPVE